MGYWLLVFLLLVFGYWLLVFGYWLLVFGYWYWYLVIGIGYRTQEIIFLVLTIEKKIKSFWGPRVPRE